MELRHTPFHSEHLKAGAKMVPFAGFEMPVQYIGLQKEHRAVRQSVGIFDVSHMGEFRVKGPKAEEALLRLLSNAVRRVDDGQAQYNIMCNHEGGVVDDLYIYRLSREEFLVCVNAANCAKDFRWMVENNSCPDGAEFIDESDEWGLLAVQGPNATAVVGRLTDLELATIGRKRLVVGTFAGIDGCVLARTGYTGEDGFEIFIPLVDTITTAWTQLLEAGADYGIQPAGLGARDTLRLEAGNVLYGHELSEELSPLQAGLGWVCKLRKPGGFIGCDALVARKDVDEYCLVAMVVDGKRIAREKMVVLDQGQQVGWVTSGTRSPTLGRSILFAYVQNAFAKVGTRLTIDVRG
ncbi:MAG: glycine cleavage system aminomethyltransferase GcvT, partial [Proteobacteria bacterium]|nr:glycine cleavage system aminomethyltransferase GcvT [Pseudomonadota bacterium]